MAEIKNEINTDNDALSLIASRNAFYKKKYYMMLGIYFFSLIVIGFLLSSLIYLFKNGSRPLYFATTAESRLIQEVPLNVPFPNNDVLAWSVKAIEEAFSYDFVNYRKQLQEAQKYFNPIAWEAYMKSLTASNNLLAVKDRQEIWISKVTQSKIIGESLQGGNYYWKVEMKVNQTRLKKPQYAFTPTSSSLNQLKVTIIVRRQGILTSYKGLEILSVVAEIVSAPTTNTFLTPLQ